MKISDKEKLKALKTKYRWIGIITVLIILVLYSIFTNNPISEFYINKDGVKVSYVKPINQKKGETIYISNISRTDSEKISDFYTIPDPDSNYISIPGEASFPLTSVDKIIMSSGEDDHQNNYLELVTRVLENGKLNVKYSDSDINGKFSVWINSLENIDGHYTFIYTTRYERINDLIEFGFREAYKKDGTWYTQISRFWSRND